MDRIWRYLTGHLDGGRRLADEAQCRRIAAIPARTRLEADNDTAANRTSYSRTCGVLASTRPSCEWSQRFEEVCESRIGLMMWHRCPYKLCSGMRQAGLLDDAKIDRYKSLMLAGNGILPGRVRASFTGVKGTRSVSPTGIVEQTRHWKLAARAEIGAILIFCWNMDNGSLNYLRRGIEACFPHGLGGHLCSYG